MKPAISTQGLILGAGVALLGIWLWPTVRRNYRQAGQVLGVGLSLSLAETKRLMAVVKEEIEDIMVDAQFERMKRAIDKQVTSLPK